MSVSRREFAAMRSAGWEIQTITPWDRLRALFVRLLVASREAPMRRWLT